MSKIEKLIEKLKSNPRDFNWDELKKVLTYYGYKEMRKGKSGGSRRKFVNSQKDVISLHKPHPENTLKTYAIKQIINHLGL